MGYEEGRKAMTDKPNFDKRCTDQESIVVLVDIVTGVNVVTTNYY